MYASALLLVMSALACQYDMGPAYTQQASPAPAAQPYPNNYQQGYYQQQPQPQPQPTQVTYVQQQPTQVTYMQPPAQQIMSYDQCLGMLAEAGQKLENTFMAYKQMKNRVETLENELAFLTAEHNILLAQFRPVSPPLPQPGPGTIYYAPRTYQPAPHPTYYPPALQPTFYPKPIYVPNTVQVPCTGEFFPNSGQVNNGMYGGAQPSASKKHSGSKKHKKTSSGTKSPSNKIKTAPSSDLTSKKTDDKATKTAKLFDRDALKQY